MKKINKFFRNIDLRKFFGTIIGGAFFLCCVAYFTYAYYEWKSDETSIALTIQEADVKCTLGPNVDVSNIGPILKIRDGVKSSFAIENSFTDDMAISVILDITSISDSLLNESFKWAIVQENESNFDYDNPIIEGSFKNFREGSNLVTTALQVPSQQTVNYEFIVYIDGNMKNDISMMQNSMTASLTLGNCGMDYVRYDELTQFAFYSADDNSLNFTYDYPVEIGSSYLGKTVTNLYTGYDTTKYNSVSAVPWYADGNYDDITTVTFLETTTPTSTAYWFNGFSNTQNMNLEKLDTSNVTTMQEMFHDCSSLTVLDVSNFDTSNVIYMTGMFSRCKSITFLDLSNFDTSNVTEMCKSWNFGIGMFSGCTSLTQLDISSIDTSKLKYFSNMFSGCSSLEKLDVSFFDTSNAIDMGKMFSCCKNLVTLNLENFDTSLVDNMSDMFSNCSSLVELECSNFNTSKVRNMYMLFEGCRSLEKIDVSNFDTRNVGTMQFAFRNCSSLKKLDLSNWDFSSLYSAAYMFYGCSNLQTLGLNATLVINSAEQLNISWMFFGCKVLTTTLVIENSKITDYGRIFEGFATLEGASIIVYYVGDNPETTDINESTYDLVEAMIATKSTKSNVINGGCKGDYCTVEEITTPVDDVI